mmetsp:Transcript_23492/g.60026  ORF Transcript_23492/g.60026 Transcript_23492/m.60026 type:complete len:401 (-) Transcript_23492:232-1434(-)
MHGADRRRRAEGGRRGPPARAGRAEAGQEEGVRHWLGRVAHPVEPGRRKEAGSRPDPAGPLLPRLRPRLERRAHRRHARARRVGQPGLSRPGAAGAEARGPGAPLLAGPGVHGDEGRLEVDAGQAVRAGVAGRHHTRRDHVPVRLLPQGALHGRARAACPGHEELRGPGREGRPREGVERAGVVRRAEGRHPLVRRRGAYPAPQDGRGGARAGRGPHGLGGRSCHAGRPPAGAVRGGVHQEVRAHRGEEKRDLPHPRGGQGLDPRQVLDRGQHWLGRRVVPAGERGDDAVLHGDPPALERTPLLAAPRARRRAARGGQRRRPEHARRLRRCGDGSGPLPPHRRGAPRSHAGRPVRVPRARAVAAPRLPARHRRDRAGSGPEPERLLADLAREGGVRGRGG